MKQSSRQTRQVFLYLVALGLLSLSMLAVAYSRGKLAVQINQDVDDVGQLRANALMIYIVENEPQHSYPSDTLLVFMSQKMQSLLGQYPLRSNDLVAAWEPFYHEVRLRKVSLATTQKMISAADHFSQGIRIRAQDEAKNSYWMLIYGALGLVLVLARGFILVQKLDQTEKALRSSERRFAMLSEATFEGVVLSENGIVRDVNPQCAQLLGYHMSEIIGRQMTDFVDAQDVTKVRNAIESQQQVTYEAVCLRKDKSTFIAEVSPRMVQFPGGLMRMTIVRDITQRKRLEQGWQLAHQQLSVSNQRWRNLATLDSLTGAYTRRAFQKVMSREIRRAGRSGLPFSVIMLDLDNFKNYNDSFGHLAGDKVLVQLVKLLRGTLRGVDIVARYGGEEFAIILVDTTARVAQAVAEQCRSEIASTPWPARQVTASLGVLTCSITSGTPVTWKFSEELTEQILLRTDRALYQSKRRGRNCVTVAEQLHVGETTSLKISNSLQGMSAEDEGEGVLMKTNDELHL